MSGATGRTWGASAPAPPTDDPQAVLTATQEKMAEQDERLERISHSLQTQSHLAHEMNDELKYQNRLLDDIDHHVDSSSMKVRQGVVQTRRVEEKAKQKGLLCVVFLLFVVIFVLFVLMLAL